MRALDLKLLRDLREMKGQVTAVALVMACGLAVMIMSRSLILSLETTREDYYDEHRFAEVFADLKRAPNRLRDRLKRIDGVAAVDTRIKGGATLDIPGMEEPADGTFLSLPEDRPQRLNLLHLEEGRLPDPGRRDEVVVSAAFAGAHDFEPGDELAATLYGSREELRITGIALSPEYVYETRPGSPIPDNRRFGVFWMRERRLAEAFDLDGAFNNVVLDLAPGARLESVKAEVDRLLEPYGGRLAYGRDEHPSAKQLDDEIRVLEGFAVAFPTIFLGIAAFMSSAVLTRLIRLQREQIAQLEAYGYGSGAIAWHYLEFALFMVGIATVLGAALGLWLASAVVGVYHQFFQFPDLDFHPAWGALAVALLVSSAASLAGVAGAVRQAVKLPAAEAMRPEAPAEFRTSLVERLGLQKLASPSFRMALRNLERKPWQATFTAVGLAFATAIPIIPGAMRDGIDYLLDFQWSQAQRQDATLQLIETGSFGAFTAMQHLPGVLAAEPFRAVSAELSHGHRSRRVSVTGLPRGNRLNRLLDDSGEPVSMPESGLLLSEKLAEVLGAEPGDPLRLRVQDGRRPERVATLAGTITDFAGIGAYMDIDALRHLMKEGSTVSGAHVMLDAQREDAFYEEVKEAPAIASLALTSAARESFNETTGEMMGTVQAIYFAFAVVVAFGVVYNGARIALSERRRDLAMLRVVGFTRREVSGVLIGELGLLTAAAILPGLWIGTQLAGVLVETASTETVRMPLVLTPRTYTTAALVVLLSSVLSFLVVSRRIRHLDLLGVLSARD